MQELRQASPRRWLLVLLLALWCCGCSSEPPAVPSPPAPPPTASGDPLPPPAPVPNAPAASGDAVPPETDADASPPTPAEEVAAADTPDPMAAPAEPAAPAAEQTAAWESDPAARQKVLLFTPAGPLLIEFVCTLHGQPFRHARDRLREYVCAQADANADQRLTWDELLAYRGLPGLPAVDNPDTARERKQQYDGNRNGLVEAEEARRYFDQAVAAGGVLTLDAARGYQDANRELSAALQAADEDADGALSAVEGAALWRALKRRDRDDDDLLLTGELQGPGRGMNADESMPLDPSQAFPSARLVSERTDAESLYYELEDRYGVAGSLRTSDLAGAGLDAERLDLNGDGELDVSEVKLLPLQPPQLVYAAHFGQRGQLPSGLVRLAVAERFAALATVQSLPGGERWRWPAGELILAAAPAAQAADAQAQFVALDGDGNGYLNAVERAAAPAELSELLAQADADGDDQLYLAEVEPVLLLLRIVQENSLQVQAGDQPDALFAWLDRDGNGRLDEREVLAAQGDLPALDRNADGLLAPDELPGSMYVRLGTGNGSAAIPGPAYVSAPASDASTADAPAWFARTDYNGDGQISRREFLGEAEQFALLDADGDGFLSLAEAAPD